MQSDKALVSDCAAASENAAIALARFDERLARAEPVLAEGARQRGHAFEAQALIGLTGGLCPLEDLVRHDAGMDVRSPTREIARAAAMLDERRRLARREPAEILSQSALRQRLGIEGSPEPDRMDSVTSTSVLARQAGHHGTGSDGTKTLRTRPMRMSSTSRRRTIPPIRPLPRSTRCWRGREKSSTPGMI